MLNIVLLLLLVLTQDASAPVVDGRITEAEWTGAHKEKLTGGGEVLLLPRGDLLFVLVNGPDEGFASLCVAKGKTVRILHASAAVGTAAFERWGDMWMKRESFKWTLRDSPRGSAPTDHAREEFFMKAGWLANASASGSPKREFKIAVKQVEYIGVTFLVTHTNAVSYWPETMSDDCRAIKVAQGYLPDTANFQPVSWHRIK